MNIVYKECIVIDDREYTVFSCDYSQPITEYIRDGVIEGDAKGIMDWIVNEVTNNLPRRFEK